MYSCVFVCKRMPSEFNLFSRVIIGIQRGLVSNGFPTQIAVHIGGGWEIWELRLHTCLGIVRCSTTKCGLSFVSLRSSPSFIKGSTIFSQ